MALLPKHLIIDGFLPESWLAELVTYALASEPALEGATIGKAGKQDDTMRRSWRDPDDLGEIRDRFRSEILRQYQGWLAPIGLQPFEASWAEIEFINHRDGDFYKPHIDTGSAAHRSDRNSDRVLSCVYYFNREPKGFDGGQLALFGFGDTEPALLIEPVNNRLVVFPSIAKHQVMRVSVPGDHFADARFAVNCWLHRARL